MKLQNLSVRAFLRKIVAGTLLTAALLLLIFFLLTKDVRVVICGIILTAAFYIWRKGYAKQRELSRRIHGDWHYGRL